MLGGREQLPPDRESLQKRRLVDEPCLPKQSLERHQVRRDVLARDGACQDERECGQIAGRELAVFRAIRLSGAGSDAGHYGSEFNGHQVEPLVSLTLPLSRERPRPLLPLVGCSGLLGGRPIRLISAALR